MLPELFFFCVFLRPQCQMLSETIHRELIPCHLWVSISVLPDSHGKSFETQTSNGNNRGLSRISCHSGKDKTSAYDEELLLLMAAPQLCRPWKLFADYFAQNFTRVFKLHCAKSRSRLRLKMKIQNTILLSHLFVLIRYVNTLVNLVRGVILWHLCAGGTNFPWDQPISFGCGGVQRGNLEYIWHGNILEK